MLATLEPFLAFFDQNRTEYLQLAILVRLAALALVIAVALYVALMALLPRVEAVRIAAPLAVFCFCFFRYGTVMERSSAGPLLNVGAWMLVTALAVAAVGLWSRHGAVCLFLAVFLGVMTLQPVLLSVVGELGADQRAAASRPASEPIAVTDREVRTPDIWWLLFDEYGRADSLDTILDLDNVPFLNQLGARGFDVSNDSYTSYPVTALSISSVLDMDYVATGPGDLATGLYDVTGPLRGEGRAVDALQAHGYRYLYADNGVFDWSQCDEGLVDTCIEAPHQGPDWGHLTRTVADLTPLRELRSEVRPDPVRTVRQAQEQMEPDQPELVFAHVLSPHQPYWFDDACGYRSQALHSSFYADRYAQQLTCLNPRILEAVDAIVDADPDAIVMLQSDHGSGVLTSPPRPLEEWSPDALAERYSIFEAMRFPEACPTPQGIHANVATFEYVLACVEGRPPVPFEDRYFFYNRLEPSEVTEIERPDAMDMNR